MQSIFPCQEQLVPGLWTDGLPPGEGFLKRPQGVALHFSSATGGAWKLQEAWKAQETLEGLGETSVGIRAVLLSHCPSFGEHSHPCSGRGRKGGH